MVCIRLKCYLFTDAWKSIFHEGYHIQLSMTEWIFLFIVFHSVFTFACSVSSYRPQRSWGKVISSQASVILLTGVGASSRGGASSQGGASSWGGVLPPGGASSRGVCFLPGGLVETTTHPPGRLLLRAVRILLECILVANSSVSATKLVAIVENVRNTHETKIV